MEQMITIPSTRRLVGTMERYIDDPLEKYDRLVEILKVYYEHGKDLRTEHLEAMLAAYLMATDIDPAEVMLVEERSGYITDNDLKVKWYYTRKDDIDENDLSVLP